METNAFDEALNPPARVDVRDRVDGRPALTSRLRRIVFSFAEALFANRQGPPPRERLEWAVDELGDFMSHAGARARFVLRLSFMTVGYMAPLLVARIGPLDRLPLDCRIRALERLEKSPFGLALLAAKAIVCVLYYEHPSVARSIGHHGSCLLPENRT